MKQITFYVDFISPYAYLAFEKLPEALAGHSYAVVYKPVLFAALLKHHGQLGPAEIASKRVWTYRQVEWLAQQQGAAFKMPDGHPFNPLPLLRLAYACASPATPNRHICEQIFHHVWRTGLDAQDPARLQALAAALNPRSGAAGDGGKPQLKAATDEAIAAGVFGVPTFMVDDRLFWGLDSLPMLRACLDGDAALWGDSWEKAAQVAVGATRKPLA